MFVGSHPDYSRRHNRRHSRLERTVRNLVVLHTEHIGRNLALAGIADTEIDHIHRHTGYIVAGLAGKIARPV